MNSPTDDSVCCPCPQIVLEGVRGSAGVLALDDIQYTVGTDCDGRVTDPQGRRQNPL